MVAQVLKAEKVPKTEVHITKMEVETLYMVEEKNFSYNSDDLIDSSNLNVNMAKLNVNAGPNYDWLADNSSTLHITNKMEYYSIYTPKTYIIKGIGAKQMHTEGHGDIILCTRHKDRIIDLKLKDVLYVPQNKYNLFALGKWDSDGRIYQGCDNKLTLFNKDC
jgi:Pol polyprotein